MHEQKHPKSILDMFAEHDMLDGFYGSLDHLGIVGRIEEILADHIPGGHSNPTLKKMASFILKMPPAQLFYRPRIMQILKRHLTKRISIHYRFYFESGMAKYGSIEAPGIGDFAWDEKNRIITFTIDSALATHRLEYPPQNISADINPLFIKNPRGLERLILKAVRSLPERAGAAKGNGWLASHLELYSWLFIEEVSGCIASRFQSGREINWYGVGRFSPDENLGLRYTPDLNLVRYIIEGKRLPKE